MPIPAVFFCFVFVFLTSGLFAQEGRPEAYKATEYQQKKEERKEYALTHLRNNGNFPLVTEGVIFLQLRNPGIPMNFSTFPIWE